MIALTQEKREELANYARARLASHVVHGGCSDEEDIFKIALAALTAAPEHYVFKHPLGKLFYSLVDESCKGHDDVYPVYTAPPVPEIKLPNNPQDAFEEGNKIPSDTQRCGTSYCVSTFHNWKGEEFMHQFEGFLKGINYVKRLNELGE
ncbi:hypothetical protein [Tatumella sp. OPLPL6]|uniref:hypothetical protein n=1 Tax=Tatumella sp. OPLPL6 TaxID=1928657 RepID=UPI000C177090|nr:hypothetical protein [Tatumella sp. OPLPL6]PIJ42674.1 hypothetical protein BOM24_11315 [Tatumella sp. OPLPL6]